MATIKLIPSTSAVSSSSYAAIANASNMYTNTDSTTHGTFTHNRASTSNTYYGYLRGFNFSTVPEDAIVTEFTVKIKASATGHTRSTSSSYYMSLVNNTTKIGSTSASGRLSTTVTTFTFENGSLDWETIKGYGTNFGIRIPLRRASSNTADVVSVYGAEIEVNYIIPTYYSITASSAVNGITLSPANQSVLEGNDAEKIIIPVNSMTNYILTDNNVDVTSQIIQESNGVQGTIEKYPESETTSGIQSGSSYAAYCIGHSAESPYNSSNNMYSSNDSTGYAEYSFDFSDIPANAIISDVSIKVNGHRENSTISSNYVSRVQAYSGSSAKGEYYEFPSTSNSTATMSNVGTWTRAELQNAKLRHTVGYYGGLLCGATWTVEYEVPGSGYHYIYTIANVQTNHVVVLEESGPYIPPTEDPDKTYWPITISSINATTNPPTGTIRVVEGTNQTITISPTNPQLTLALDNGVDITSQLTGGTPLNTYTVTSQVSGASYGFNLNSSTGYYVSTNNGVSNSAAICRVNFNFETSCLVTIQYINYAEATYDYGVFGNVDTTLNTSYNNNTGAYYTCSASSDNTSTSKTLTYTIPAGSHYIDIKYRKDQATNSNNDNLQWKISNITATSSGGDYTYTLTNITQKHSLVFVFGNVNFYYISSSTTSGARIFPDGQIVVLEGDNYVLNIIPDDTGATITLKDNNVNVTSSLTREDGFDKNGNLIVNYKYSLTNIQATHGLVVQVDDAIIQMYLKINGNWIPYNNIYKKINGSWVLQSDLTTVFSSSNNYRKGN